MLWCLVKTLIVLLYCQKGLATTCLLKSLVGCWCLALPVSVVGVVVPISVSIVRSGVVIFVVLGSVVLVGKTKTGTKPDQFGSGSQEGNMPMGPDAEAVMPAVNESGHLVVNTEPAEVKLVQCEMTTQGDQAKSTPVIHLTIDVCKEKALPGGFHPAVGQDSPACIEDILTIGFELSIGKKSRLAVGLMFVQNAKKQHLGADSAEHDMHLKRALVSVLKGADVSIIDNATSVGHVVQVQHVGKSCAAGKMPSIECHGAGSKKGDMVIRQKANIVSEKTASSGVRKIVSDKIAGVLGPKLDVVINLLKADVRMQFYLGCLGVGCCRYWFLGFLI